MNIRLEDVLTFSFICCSALCASRVKRIIDGIPLLTRTSGYNAVRYYVWISNGKECSIKPGLSRIPGLEEDERLIWSSFNCAPDPSNIQCGGSLISPKIVQTACHCLALFAWSSDENKSRRAVLETHFEGRFKVHLGTNQVKDFSIGIPTSKHFVHQKCTQISYKPFSTLWDYGWMVLQFSVEKWKDLPSHLIDYAPQYTRDELVNIWEHTLQTQAVCLILGFGGFREVYPRDSPGTEDLLEGPYEEPSAVLRYGWVSTAGYLKCKNLTDFKPRKSETLSYVSDATWGCGIPFTRELRTFGAGDSGGPTSCNNHYIGVNSATANVRINKFGKARSWIPLYLGLRFVLLENAVEYRKTFIRHIDHYSEFTKNNMNQPFISLRVPFRQSSETRGNFASS